MKNFAICIALAGFLWIGTAFHLQADPASAVAALKAQLQKASETRDLNAVKLCYDFDGAPPFSVDASMHNVWEEYFNLNDKTSHYIFEKIVYRSLDEVKADKTINQKAILSIIKPQNMNGTVYQPNLKIIGFMIVSFKQGFVDGSSMEPVGIDTDGTAKLVMLRPIK